MQPDPNHLLRVASTVIAECIATGDYRPLAPLRDRIDRELLRRDEDPDSTPEGTL